MSIQLKKAVRRYTPRKTMSHKTLDSIPPPIVVRPKAGKCSYRILTFSLSHFFLRKFEYRQLLKIPRSKKCYYEIKELLRALTSSMLLSLERANAQALLFTRLIATFTFFLPKSFYFFFNRIARYALQRRTSVRLQKNPQITCKAIFRSCLKYKDMRNIDLKIMNKKRLFFLIWTNLNRNRQAKRRNTPRTAI